MIRDVWDGVQNRFLIFFLLTDGWWLSLTQFISQVIHHKRIKKQFGEIRSSNKRKNLEISKSDPFHLCSNACEVGFELSWHVLCTRAEAFCHAGSLTWWCSQSYFTKPVEISYSSEHTNNFYSRSKGVFNLFFFFFSCDVHSMIKLIVHCLFPNNRNWNAKHHIKHR